MDKIILAINSMIINSDKITDILKGKNEYFFKYDDKYIWGILERKDGVIALSYYSEAKEVKDMDNYFCNLDNCITYSSNLYKTPEALESFQELYTLISKEKGRKNVDKILNNIIGE